VDSYRSSRSGRSYRFGFVRLNELTELAVRHPQVHSILPANSWHYVSRCPGIRGDFPLYFYLLDEAERIVCSAKTLPDLMTQGGREYRWAWIGALFTDPGCRGEGLATYLEGRSRDIFHAENTAWSSAFSADASIRVHQKLGFHLVGHAPTWVLLKSVRPLLRARMGWRLPVNLADIVARPLLRLGYRRVLGHRSRWPRIERVRVPLEEREARLSAAPPLVYDEACHFDDQPAKIIWKIEGAGAPKGNRCDLYMLWDEAGNPLAYLIVRVKQDAHIGPYRDFRLMSLLDFGMYRYDATVHLALVGGLLDVFWNSEAEVLEVVSNERGLIEALRRAGARSVGRGMPFTIDLPPGWAASDKFRYPISWRLTSFCGDGFTF